MHPERVTLGSSNLETSKCQCEVKISVAVDVSRSKVYTCTSYNRLEVLLVGILRRATGVKHTVHNRGRWSSSNTTARHDIHVL